MVDYTMLPGVIQGHTQRQPHDPCRESGCLFHAGVAGADRIFENQFGQIATEGGQFTNQKRPRISAPGNFSPESDLHGLLYDAINLLFLQARLHGAIVSGL